MSESFKVRASSWARLFDCAHAWEGTHLLGLKKASSPRAFLGNAIHHGTAVFDSSKIRGGVISVDDAVGEFVDFINYPQFDVDWSVDTSITQRQAIGVGCDLVSQYCTEVSPKYQFEAVEMETQPLDIDCGHGVIITLTGTLDRSRVRLSGEGRGIDDIKTGRVAVTGKGEAKTKGFAAQIGTYELLYEHTTGQPITAPGEIIGLKTSGKPEIGFGQIKNAKELLVGSSENHGLIEYAKAFFRTGLFPPNPSSQLCSEKYCARWETCKYK